MKIILSLILTLIASNSFAANWSIKKKKNIFILENKKSGNFYQVRSSGGVPKFLEVKKLNKKFTIVVYYSGTAGTSTPIDIQRAVLLKNKELNYMGDFPYKYIGVKEQPIWKVKSDQVIITDSATGLKKTVD